VFDATKAVTKYASNCYFAAKHFSLMIFAQNLTFEWPHFFQGTRINVEHFLLFMFSPPKIHNLDCVCGIKYICLFIRTVLCLTQPSNKQMICFDFEKQNSILPYCI